MASNQETREHRASEAPLRATSDRASLIIELEGEIRAVALREDTSLVVGRTLDADVVLEHHTISRRHARFGWRHGAISVEDLGSTNGVKVAGELVPAAVLGEGDVVELGAARITVTGIKTAERVGQLRSWSIFRAAVDAEIERARLFGRAFSLFAVRARGPSHQAWFRLSTQLRSVDAGTVHTPDLALVMLPETGGSTALEIARKLAERLGEPIACSIATFPEHASQLESLIECVVHAARSAKLGSVTQVHAGTPSAAQSGPVVASEAMLRLYGLIDRIARATLPVLVLGETGAGKELVARAVHDRSARRDGAFVAINCASIPANLLESVLFGHERGAFTGASERREGVFEQADGGTVFLDEVGELTAPVQAALLRVLETKRVTRLGSPKETAVDVRVVAATHRNLEAMVAQGSFREDLMFRLDALTLSVPPLRERVAEIEPLAERFLAQAKEQWGVLPSGLTHEARTALRAYRWPGNVRQLRNVVERAAVVCTRKDIDLDDLPEAIVGSSSAVVAATSLTMPPPASTAPSRALPPTSAPTSEAPLADSLGDGGLVERVQAYEARLIREALSKTSGNQTKAAAMLKVPRRTLTSKIHALGIGQPDDP